MTKRNRTSLLLATAAMVAASCSKIGPINAPALTAGRADFSVVAAVGTSITAGYQSGGLVDRHQIHSYASLFAQQVGASPLDLPLINGAGIPPLLEVKRLVPPPVQIGPINALPGLPTNDLLGTTYHNLGVPGALTRDLADTSFYLANPYFPLIQRSHGSIARQLAEQLDPPPTFLLVEYGSSELLRPALQGTTAGLLSTVAFAETLVHALDTLQTLLPGVEMAVVNVPDITGLPFFTTVSNRLLDAAGRPMVDINGRPRFLLGPNAVPLTANDQVLLTALTDIGNGKGYPLGTTSYLSGVPMPGLGSGLTEDQVLTATESITLQERARRFNGVIDTASASIAVPRDIAVVDLDGLLRRARTTGIEMRRVVYTTTFVTGGLISLDGIHPNDLAQALLCNEVIEAVNRKFGSNIQPLDPLRFATVTASRAGASSGAP